MLSKIGIALRNKKAISIRKFSVTNNEFLVFPRESEGNIYSVNYSLTEDGVTPVGDAFRNARLPVLVNRLNVKLQNNVAELTKPVYFGDFKVEEAGDGITHDAFTEDFNLLAGHLSSGVTLFVEDGGIGAHNKTRLGVRVTSDDAATALIFRKLLVSLQTSGNV